MQGWLGGKKRGDDMADGLGPEKFAPLHRRLAEKRKDSNEKVVPLLANEQAEPAPAATSANEKIDALIRQIAGDSMDQIDRVIRDLERLRDMMRSEGQRISGEIVDYARINQSTTTAMKVITESLQQWKRAPQNNDRNDLL